MLTAGFMSRGLPALQAQKAALTALNAQVSQQAAMLSYNDSWIFILIAFVAVSPAILLLRKAKAAAGMPADAH
jgi:hypothetical protein